MASFQGELNVEDNSRVEAACYDKHFNERGERVHHRSYDLNFIPQINYSLCCQTLRGDLCGMFEMLI